ncbi:pentatricopeptide repeat-containing protein At5g67570, chloroplastic [Mercurialis annua]|uniref:pentatricopeptide repeat-containing protein At5g67570, chloroplastic n=1 Tax=Mercurialis annua TaxID=3986 RepID=UPI00215F24CD|nr:pentatricopeptide repeat-containing protein At5g67570, chloroplastic [Mercurialis annua]
MEAASTVPSPPPFEPNLEAIKHKLLKHNIHPTPKILRNLRKKQIQKHNRKLSKTAQTQLTHQEKQALAEESHFQTLKNEYKTFSGAIRGDSQSSGLLVGMPWERIERVKLREIASGSNEFDGGNKLRVETLRELKEVFEDGLKWVLDNDIEFEGGDDGQFLSSENQSQYDPTKRSRNDKEEIRFLVSRLSKRDFTVRDWKLAKIMKQSGLRFNEGQLMMIVKLLGKLGKWEQAMAIVEWVYNDKERKNSRSRFVYTKLLSVLRIERRPKEALHIFNLMREDHNIYPDMAAYHVIAVTLGQAGWVKELLKIVECMREKPSKRTNSAWYKHCDPILEPDMVIYNAVLNACVPTQQWKGVSWVFGDLRKSGLKPNGATYGLSMEVMLNSGKYDLVHELFRKMNRSGETPTALTYKVIVRALWEEGKVDAAVEAVRSMERRGVVGNGSLYYELACCLCYYGRWQDAVLEVKNMRKLRHSKPLEVTFTGMIMSSLDGGHVSDGISIFEFMKDHCVPNIGTINIMLKVYGRNDLFTEAKELFEEYKGAKGDNDTVLIPDEFTYSSMLEASASALQWEYFEHVYKEMTFSGYQLDQSKHASLLVKASRAGKCHLLEHAFDAALEAGEIPHHYLFTEMVFQAAIQQNYERSVILVNTLALAPFQISERQWTELFEKNRDEVTQESLENLLDALRKSDYASEPTVANLSRTLHSLCGRGKSVFLPSSTDSAIDVICGSNEVASPQNYSTDREGTADIRNNLESLGCDEAYGESTEPLKDFDATEFEISIDQIDDSRESKSPSANEILDAWKESRKDGLFFPFQRWKKV